MGACADTDADDRRADEGFERGVAVERDEGLRRWAARGTDPKSDVEPDGRRGGNDGVHEEIRCGRRGRAVRGDQRQVPEVTRIAVGVTAGLQGAVVIVKSHGKRSEYHEQYCRERREPPQRNHAPNSEGKPRRSQGTSPCSLRSPSLGRSDMFLGVPPTPSGFASGDGT